MTTQTANLPYSIEAATAQHIGDRIEQQDRVAIIQAKRAPGYLLAILADGMGGSKGGALAAEQIIHTTRHLMTEFSPKTHRVEDFLEEVLNESHTIINLIAISANNQPHTTLVALMLTPNREAIWGHAGDSRLYRFSNNQFCEHTVDHSYVEMMVERGELTREEAKDHQMSNVLLNGLGGKLAPYITINRHTDLQVGDSFLLCSDGLWHYFNEVELAPIIAANTPREASTALIKKARIRAHGNGDNCSLIIIKLVPFIPPEIPKKEKTFLGLGF